MLKGSRKRRIPINELKRKQLEAVINGFFEEKFRQESEDTLVRLKNKIYSGKYKRKSDFIFGNETEITISSSSIFVTK